MKEFFNFAIIIFYHYIRINVFWRCHFFFILLITFYSLIARHQHVYDECFFSEAQTRETIKKQKWVYNEMFTLSELKNHFLLGTLFNLISLVHFVDSFLSGIRNKKAVNMIQFFAGCFWGSLNVPNNLMLCAQNEYYV